MIQFFKISILASFLLLASFTSAQAEPSSQQCNTRWAQDFIGKYLTLAVKEEARKTARAITVVVNSLDRQHQNNRLRIQTDLDLKITHLDCG
ncbi:peptidase inhibitor [Pseudomonas sp. SWRI153]|uniref:Peptidase inhibitor n=1 Tax=Pseudomonas khorasanensis TaxID=2745508 RepID=A0A923JEI2_9PSED|nr:peptidase inhibitor [Pseudomonas khorasanensis]MBV4485941.1 peptidase inhibitor [Pseudomonas khorasanensis]